MARRCQRLPLLCPRPRLCRTAIRTPPIRTPLLVVKATRFGCRVLRRAAGVNSGAGQKIGCMNGCVLEGHFFAGVLR